MKKIFSNILAVSMLLVMGVSTSASEIEAKSCSHSWSSWRTTDIYYTYGETIFDCYQEVEQQMRYCTKCNDTQMREFKTQLEHIWRNSRCTTCGAVRTDVRKIAE